MKKKLNEELKFTIGEQYENYEFDLETKECLDIQSLGIKYECYKYIKQDFNTIFGVEIDNGVYLLFNGDILCAVFYKFKSSQYKYIKDKLNFYLQKEISENVTTKYCKVEVEFKNTTLELTEYFNKETILCYQSQSFKVNNKY